MAAGGEFVEGWLVAQILGEGAYGEVRLLVHARSGAAVALKAVQAQGRGQGAREAALHRALRHPRVLRCLGERTHQGLHYMFLEYAQGGELFDRIEPDVGMNAAAARRYWRQLLEGLQYLHGRGVAHRDIKPENLLLDAHDNLKISDFGMATLFRHGSSERLLSRVCGTLPYAAPEVLQADRAPYRAAPADAWAAALVLAAMLAGELPWERACPQDERYAAWLRWLAAGEGAAPAPFGKLPGAARSLLRRALAPRAQDRPALDRLMAAKWLTQDDDPDGGGRLCRSQPAGLGETETETEASGALHALLSHSQPAHADDLLLASQLSSPATPPSMEAWLVRRMTRVRVRAPDAQHALAALAAAAHALSYSARLLHDNLMAIECDSEVKMRAWATRGGGAAGVLLEVRRSRGCGLEFKRRYLRLRQQLQHLALPDH